MWAPYHLSRLYLILKRLTNKPITYVYLQTPHTHIPLHLWKWLTNHNFCIFQLCESETFIVSFCGLNMEKQKRIDEKAHATTMASSECIQISFMAVCVVSVHARPSLLYCLLFICIFLIKLLTVFGPDIMITIISYTSCLVYMLSIHFCNHYIFMLCSLYWLKTQLQLVLSCHSAFMYSV